MIKEFWINLPVRDVDRSKRFFNAIGFASNPGHPDSDKAASLLVGSKNMVLMLFEESVFKSFIHYGAADTLDSSGVLFSIDAENRNEVDTLAVKVRDAGGSIFAEPAESQGWMYGFGFADPDGHRWNVLYMDMKNMPGRPA